MWSWNSKSERSFARNAFKTMPVNKHKIPVRMLKQQTISVGKFGTCPV